MHWHVQHPGPLFYNRDGEKCLQQLPRAQSNVNHVSFVQTNSPKHKNSSFTVINDKEMQQMLHVRNQKQQIFDIFAWKNDWNDQSTIKIVV